MKHWSIASWRGGIIGFVTNGRWLTGFSGAGFRKSIVQEYTTIYVINLRGDSRTFGELQKQEGEGIFGDKSRVPAAITFLIKTPNLITKSSTTVYYYAVEDYLKKQDKFNILNSFQNVTNVDIPWTIITPDARGDWFDKAIDWPTNSFPFRNNSILAKNVFKVNSWSFLTCRDSWVVNFDKAVLITNIKNTINFYELERQRLTESIKNKTKPLLVTKDNKQISWSHGLLNKLQTNRLITYNASKLFKCQYYPFIIKQVYFDSSLIDSPYQQPLLFLTKPFMNRAIIVSFPGSTNHWSVFITNQLYGLKSVCFPEYTYQTNQDGTITTLNAINDNVLKYAQSLYNDSTITTIDIFDYLYGLLHHPKYQLQYKNNLQKGYPNLIWVADKTTWWTIINIGRKLANLHLNFETIASTTTFSVIIKEEFKDNYYVTKMQYDKKTNTLKFNNDITIPLPTNIHNYQVFGRSPLKWIIDYYQITINKETGIKNDPNQIDSVQQNSRYLLDLVLSVINLTTQTLALIDELTKQVIS